MLTIIGISGAMYSNWSVLFKSTDLNRLLYWGIPCLPSLTVSRPHSHQILLTAEEDGTFMRLNHTHTNCLKEGWLHQASIEVVSNSEITHLPTIGVAYEWFHGATPTCNPSLTVFGLDRLAGLEFWPCSKEGQHTPGRGYHSCPCYITLNRQLLNTLDY